MTESNDWQTPRGTTGPGQSTPGADETATSTPSSQVSAVESDAIEAGGPELGAAAIATGTPDGYPLGGTASRTREGEPETADETTEPRDFKQFRGFETGAAERTGGSGGD